MRRYLQCRDSGGTGVAISDLGTFALTEQGSYYWRDDLTVPSTTEVLRLSISGTRQSGSYADAMSHYFYVGVYYPAPG